MKLKPHYLVDENGEKTAAVLSMKDFRELLDAAQDAIDLRLINEVREQPRVPWEKTKQSRGARTRSR